MAEPDGPRLLGIDIGGTRSRARLCTGGQITAESQGPSASLPAAGRDQAEAALRGLLDDLKLDPAEQLDAICVGSAGLSVPGAREFLHEQLAPLTRPGALAIVTDIQLVLPAAGLTEGVAVICGTGSVAVGSHGGRTVQVGGWGFLLGDEGGGYWVVREALRVLLDRRDHGVAPGELGDQLLAAIGAKDLAALHRLVYQQPHRPSAGRGTRAWCWTARTRLRRLLPRGRRTPQPAWPQPRPRSWTRPAACRLCWPAACSATPPSGTQPAKPSPRRCPERR